MKNQHYDPFKKDGDKKAPVKRPAKEEATTERYREPFDRNNPPLDAAILREHREGAQQATVPESPLPKARRTFRRKYPVSSFVTAGFWIRFVAFCIDATVASAFSAIFASPIVALAGRPEGIFPAAVSGFFFYLYFVLFTYFTDGQTLGKMITGIRVIHKEESRLSPVTVIVREFFCRLIQTTFPILYVITAFTERKQNIGDLLSDTYVVKDDLYAVERDHEELFYAHSA